MFFSIIISIITLAIIDWFWRYYEDIKGNIAGPTPLPFIGNALEYAGHTPESLIKKAIGECKKYGGSYRVWALYKRVIVIVNPEDIECILNNSKNIMKNEIYDLLLPWLNTGLLISSGSKWFTRRKIITPAFHFSILEQFINIFDQHSKILIEKFQKHSEDEEAFNVHPYIVRATLDVISAGLEILQTECKKYNGLYRIWIFQRRIIEMFNPKDLEIIMTSSKHIMKNEIYDFLVPWLNTGLLLSSGSKWFTRRKIITPAFHFSILEQFIQIFDQHSEMLVKKLKKHSEDEKAFNVHPYIVRATLDVISESALGIKVNSQEDPECDYLKAIERMSDIVSERFLNPHLQPNFLFATLGHKLKKEHDKLLNSLHSFTTNIIKERRKCLEQDLLNTSTITIDNESIYGKKKRMALLDMLLQVRVDNKSLSDDDIREEVDTFTFEGHDTTTSGICFTLYCISRHPEIQKKMFEEIRNVFGDDKNKSTTYKDLQQLKYTELVIKESLRMYPPVSFIGRLIEEDVNVNGKLLTAGTSIHFNLIITMRNPKYFPEPDKFIPERHLAETSAETLNPFAYIPFSAGPRNCIGQKYAMLELKSVISKILRHYELLPKGEEVKPFINVILRSRTGFQFAIKPRMYT